VIVVHDLGPASREVARVAAQVTDADLDRPTPCGEWSVRDLLGHLLAFTGHFVGVARHEPGQAGGPPAELPADWRADLDARLADLAAVWAQPSAWEGEGSAGGLTMPRAQLGIVAVEELVLHGWDLARAVGAEFAVRDEDLAVVAEFVGNFEHAPQEQRTGLYGPVVHAETTTDLDRVLALAGRDPQRPITAPAGP
jgi:uncharacterized protein (TIGR03086 family)